MKTWSVFVRGEEAAAVAHGFHWWAFFFPVLWALYFRMWGMAAASYATIYIAGNFWPDSAGANAVLQTIAWALVGALYASRATVWRGEKLQAQGFSEVATVTAYTADGALEHWRAADVIAERAT